jgi:nicotinamide phosphoribosyltransferase
MEGHLESAHRDPMKHSKAGRLALQYVDGDYRTVRRESIPPEENLLRPVFRNGKLLRKWDFTELIARSERKFPTITTTPTSSPR